MMLAEKRNQIRKMKTEKLSFQLSRIGNLHPQVFITGNDIRHVPSLHDTHYDIHLPEVNEHFYRTALHFLL